MTDLTKQLPVEILKMIFQSLSLQDLSMVVLVCRRWREVGETPSLWSEITVTVDERNQSVVTEILSSRRMEAVRKIVIDYGVSVSEEGCMSVIGHTGLRQMEVEWDGMYGVEPGLVGRVVTSMETVSVRFLTVKQVTAVCSEICDRDTLTLKVLDISGNPIVRRVEPGLLARAVTRLEEVKISDTFLTVEQVTAIISDIWDKSTLRLKVLDISRNPSVSKVEPGLLARAVTKLKTLNVTYTKLTVEQEDAIREAAARSSCIVIGI